MTVAPPQPDGGDRQEHSVGAASYDVRSSGSYSPVAIGGARASVSVARFGDDLAADGELPEHVDEGLRLVRELPTRAVPEAGAVPAVSHFDRPRNHTFGGRDADLATVAAMLADAGPVASPTVVITGIGGIGKSQLASEFVHRYGRFFLGGVFWIDCDVAEGVTEQVAECGASLFSRAAVAFDHLTPSAQYHWVRNRWSSPMPRLLVFDNCETEELLARLRPVAGGCRTLVTARRANWSTSLGVQVHRLAPTRRADSIELLRRLSPTSADHDLDEIAGELADLPLALHLAGSYLHQVRLEESAAEYLAALRGADRLGHSSMNPDDGAVYLPTDHAPDLARTFQISVDRLDAAQTVDRAALAVLGLIAWLAVGAPVPRSLVGRVVETQVPADPSMAAGRVVARLVDLGLVDEDRTGALSMHRLIGDTVRNNESVTAVPRDVEQVLLDVVRPLTEQGEPAAVRPFGPHLRIVVDRTTRGGSSPLAAELNMLLAEYLMMADRAQAEQIGADLEAARTCLERALAIRTEAGCGPELLAETLISLGQLTTYTMDPAARSILERALELRRRVLGEAHVLTAEARAAVAAAAHAVGDYRQAREFYEAALSGLREAAGGRERQTASALSGLGNVLSDLGDQAGAAALAREALVLQERVLGPRHPDVAGTLCNLGDYLRETGDAAEARVQLEQALALFHETYGQQHPHTAAAHNNLANTLVDLDQREEALRHSRRSLEIVLASYGELHPWTARNLMNLANIYSNLGNQVLAWELCEESYDTRVRLFGRNHPEVGASLMQIAGRLEAEGEVTSARRTFERAERIYRATYGDVHPHLGRMILPALVRLIAEEEPDRAVKLQRDAVAIVERCFGAEHRYAADVQFELARMLEARDPDQALELHRRALATRGASDRPRAEEAVSAYAVGSLLRARRKFAAARDAFEHATWIDSAVYGPAHHEVLVDRTAKARTWLDEGKPAEARVLLRDALAATDESPPEAASAVLQALDALVVASVQLDDIGAAVSAARRAISLSPPDFRRAERMIALGDLLQRGSRPAEARAAREDALAFLAQHTVVRTAVELTRRLGGA